MYLHRLLQANYACDIDLSFRTKGTNRGINSEIPGQVSGWLSFALSKIICVYGRGPPRTWWRTVTEFQRLRRVNVPHRALQRQRLCQHTLANEEKCLSLSLSTRRARNCKQRFIKTGHSEIRYVTPFCAARIHKGYVWQARRSCFT